MTRQSWMGGWTQHSTKGLVLRVSNKLIVAVRCSRFSPSTWQPAHLSTHARTGERQPASGWGISDRVHSVSKLPDWETEGTKKSFEKLNPAHPACSSRSGTNFRTRAYSGAVVL